MQMLVTSQQAEEILVDLDNLIDLSIVPADFPLPQDPELRSEKCRRIEENKKNIAEYVEKLEKKIEEEEKRVTKQADSSLEEGLESCGSPPVRGHPKKQSSYTINPAIEEVGPKLTTIQERQGSLRSSLQFHRHDEENIDEDLDVEKLRKKLMRKYSSVFKRDLGK